MYSYSHVLIMKKKPTDMKYIRDQRMDVLHLIHIGIDYISLDTIPSVRWCMLSSM